jgi:hypothetical protein
MPIPLQITFRGLEPSDTIEYLVREKATRLERFCDRIASCHIVIEAPSRHRRKGGMFRVAIKLDVPGAELAIGRDHSRDHTHEDFRVALRDAFAAAARKLEDHVRVKRGDVKTHAANAAYSLRSSDDGSPHHW